MKFELLHPADQIVMIMERIYKYGMTTTSGGNLSILDDNGDIWITPGGIDKGNLTRRDIMQIKPDGTIIGIHRPSVELPFHSEVYNKRDDVKAVLHAHPPALVAFSIARKVPDTNLIPNASQVCGEVGMAPYDVPGSSQLGDKIAKVFEEGIDTVMLENHGIVVAGKDLYEAFMRFETLEFCARLEIKANSIGNARSLSDKDLMTSTKKQAVKMDEFIPSSFSSVEKEVRREMCELIKRSYDQMLFTSTQGTFSQKIGEDSFIITPYGLDRKYIEAEDLVRIDNDQKELNKIPSRSALLHKFIYEKNPEIKSIIIAHPPNIMAFAVTDAIFDSRTIPESYIMLRDVPVLPFGSSFMQQELTASVFSESTPVIMIENDCIIATGNSLLNAFDRLEVAEYSAKAIISAKNIGEVVNISKDEVVELNKAFNLK